MIDSGPQKKKAINDKYYQLNESMIIARDIMAQQKR